MLCPDFIPDEFNLRSENRYYREFERTVSEVDRIFSVEKIPLKVKPDKLILDHYSSESDRKIYVDNHYTLGDQLHNNWADVNKTRDLAC